MFNKTARNYFFITIMTVASSLNANAQTEWQSWNSLRVNASITEKLSTRIGYLKAYDLSGKSQNIFNQASFQLSYDINRAWDINGGLQLITPVSSKDTRKRIFLTGAHRTRLNKVVWTQSLRIETNSKNENRFRQRIIAGSRLGLRKRLDFLNLAPSISYSIFYNIGGDSLRYYNDNAEVIARQTPDGFHRSRITVNLNSKVNKYLNISLYYLRQQEFNFLTADTRKINVKDPARNRILRPFNNFNTVGLSADINLDKIINN